MTLRTTRRSLLVGTAATANGAGYRYGTSDQAAYVPAVMLAENPSARLPRSQIVVASGPLTVQPDVTIEVGIGRFEAEAAGTVVLTAQWVTRREKPRLAISSIPPQTIATSEASADTRSASAR